MRRFLASDAGFDRAMTMIMCGPRYSKTSRVPGRRKAA